MTKHPGPKHHPRDPAFDPASAREPAPTDRLLHRLLGAADDETGTRRTQRPTAARPTKPTTRAVRSDFPFSIFKASR